MSEERPEETLAAEHSSIVGMLVRRELGNAFEDGWRWEVRIVRLLRCWVIDAVVKLEAVVLVVEVVVVDVDEGVLFVLVAVVEHSYSGIALA